jgi:hypothetical protein
MKTPFSMKCPSCGHEKKLKTDDYKKPELTKNELKIKEKEIEIGKIEGKILNGEYLSIKDLMPY